MYLTRGLKGELYLCTKKPVKKPSRIDPNGFYWSIDFSSGKYMFLENNHSVAEDLEPGEMKEVELVEMEESLEVPQDVEPPDVPDYKALAAGDKDAEVPF